MADHPRLAVLKAFTTLLQEISIVNGYNTDLQQRVYRGRSEFGENDPVPFISILEAPKPDPAAIYGGAQSVRHEQWQLLIQGFAQDDPENPTDPLYPLLADVEQCLALKILAEGSPQYMLPDAGGNPRITGLEILPPVTRPPGSTSTAKACFFLPLRVGLALDVG